MADPAGSLPPTSDTAGTAPVAHALRCVQCSYDLRGLAADALCPECGTPIRQSMQGRLLRFASSAYLARLTLGTALLIAGLVASLAFPILWIALSCAGLSRWLSAAHSLQLIPPFVLIAGYWLYSTPDPGFAPAEQPVSARRLLRAAVITQGAIQILSFAVQALGWISAPAFVGGFRGGAVVYRSTVPGVSLAQSLLWMGLSVAGLAAWAVQFFAAMGYTRWLARRIPDPGLIRTTRTYSWLLPVLTVVGAPLFLLGPIIALVLYAVLLGRVRTRLEWIAGARAREAEYTLPG